MVETISRSPLPTPTCVISSHEDCVDLWTAYYSSVESFTSSYRKSVSEERITKPPAATEPAYTYFDTWHERPPCSRTDLPEACPTAAIANETTVNCYVTGYYPTLIYWPTLSDFCNPNTVSATPTPTTPPATQTAVYQDVTVTSPTAILIYKSAHGITLKPTTIKRGGTTSYVKATYRCGPDPYAAEVTLKVPESDMSSYVWNSSPTGAAAAVKPFNYAHLYKVPYDIYSSNGFCHFSPTTDAYYCRSTMYDDYAPTIAIPPQATEGPNVPKNCQAGMDLRGFGKYVPITATTITDPLPT
jgi:hypothetical protein